MTDLIVLGTDTDAGKTTFSLLFLTLYAEQYAYWKPVETGTSDSERIRQLVPSAHIQPTLAHFQEAVAPPLAARRAGQAIPSAQEILAAQPLGPLLLETFGSPFSPLTETELQLAYLQRLAVPMILVSSSAIGAIGRTLQTLHALNSYGITPCVVVLLGTSDPFAEEQLRQHWRGGIVVSLQPPATWDVLGVQRAAREQRQVLEQCHRAQTPLPIPDDYATLDPFIWHPYTSLRDPDVPLCVVGMAGSFLHLTDGRKIIDGISSWWTIQHGHRHPPLMKGLHEAAQTYDHVLFAGVTHPPALELAELLLQTMPWTGGRIFYSDNGSTAVEVALKMAYQFWCQRGEPQRTLFVGFEHGYHGDTFGAMAVGRDPLFFGRFDPLLFHVEQITVSAQRLDELLTHKAGQVAAVILEPLVQGAGGMRMHTAAELADIFAVTRRHNVLFIADEVMTGGGRTGTRWAYEAAQIAPDLICAAKTLTGGVLPLAATLVAPHIVAAFDTDDRSRTFFHGHSFTANPLACAVAVANQHLMNTGLWQRQVEHINAVWQRELSALRAQANVRDVRICGSIAAIEVNDTGGYLANSGRIMRHKALAQGVLLRPLGNVLYTMPPFDSSEEVLQQIVAAIRQAI